MKYLDPFWMALVGIVGFAAGAALRSGEGAGGLSEEERRILGHMRFVELPDGAGGQVATIRFEGVNVQIVSGSGATESADGRGNLIVGYNEDGCRYGDKRSGSHNLVVGSKNSYESFGGIVVGHGNAISAPFASVSGGEYNVAEGYAAAVSGGLENVAEGRYASVTGGKFNRASGIFAAITGGHLNVASGLSSAVTGGFRNLASGNNSGVSGGVLNKACAEYTSVSGGVQLILNKHHAWGAGVQARDF